MGLKFFRNHTRPANRAAAHQNRGSCNGADASGSRTAASSKLQKAGFSTRDRLHGLAYRTRTSMCKEKIHLFDMSRSSDSGIWAEAAGVPLGE
jgi:hypothetical protein